MERRWHIFNYFLLLNDIMHNTNKSSHWTQTSANANPVRSPTWLSKFSGDFFVKGYIYDKIFTKTRSDFSATWAKLWKNALSRCWRILQKFIDPDPKADDFQNLISSSLSTDDVPGNISRRYDKQLTTAHHQVANRQTDRQTDRRQVKHNFGGDNEEQCTLRGLTTTHDIRCIRYMYI